MVQTWLTKDEGEAPSSGLLGRQINGSIAVVSKQKMIQNSREGLSVSHGPFFFSATAELAEP